MLLSRAAPSANDVPIDLFPGRYTHSRPWTRHRSHLGICPLHLAFLAWQLRHAWRTRRLGTLMLVVPVLSTTSIATFSSYEHAKPRRSQLVQMPRRPSHRTLRARQVTHVWDGRGTGRGEALMWKGEGVKGGEPATEHAPGHADRDGPCSLRRERVRLFGLRGGTYDVVRVVLRQL